MDSLMTVLIYAAVIFGVSVVVSNAPLVLKNVEKQIHNFLAISAGLMLGVIFLMILPEAVEESIERNLNYVQVFGIILAGFLLVFFIDLYLQRNHCGEHSHEFTSMAAFGGLAIHAMFDGISLAAGFVVGEGAGTLILVAICVHKCAEAFALGSTMAASLGKKEARRNLVLFSAITPVSSIVAYFLVSGESSLTGPAMALSSGILLFVVVCGMLPEVLHDLEKKSVPIRGAMFGIGVAIAAVVWIIINGLTGGAGI